MRIITSPASLSSDRLCEICDPYPACVLRSRSAGTRLNTRAAGISGSYTDTATHVYFQRGRRDSSPQPRSSGSPQLHTRRSEEHTSELQSLMRISYAVFCLKSTMIVIRQHVAEIGSEHV